MTTLTLLETSRICTSADGLLLAQRAFNLALAAARRDVEMDFQEAQDDAGRWINTNASVFTGEGQHEKEYRAIGADSLHFLQHFDVIQAHPFRQGWIRFKGVDQVEAQRAEPVFLTEDPDHVEGEPA